MQHITTHVDDAIAQLIDLFKKDPNAVALATAFIKRIQEIEEALWQLILLRDLNTAVGEQLDGIGSLVGRAREGADDDLYRVRLRVQIALNTSSGTAEEVYSIFRLLLPATPLRITDYYPASFVLRASGTLPADPVNTGVILQTAKAAGVEAQLHYGLVDDSAIFTLSATSSVTSDVNRGLNGGHLMGAV